MMCSRFVSRAVNFRNISDQILIINYHNRIIMNRIIKMEEDEYPISSDYDQAFFNNCITTFYNQDSSQQQIMQAKCTANEVIYYISQTVDICDTPLAVIMENVMSNPSFQGVDLDVVKRKVMKQKNILKRNRAKNRKFVDRSVKITQEISVTNDQESQEYKKQRNRMSAQISRDRKKERVRELQDMNKKLQEECNNQRMENQKLQEQLNKSKSNKDNSFGPLKNKFTKLLILLGIICLFGMIKDIFSSNEGQSTTTYNKIQQKNNLSLSAVFKSKEANLSAFSQQEQAKAMKFVEAPLEQIFEDKTFMGRIKDRIDKKIKQCNFSDWFSLSGISKQVNSVKKYVLQ